MHISFRLGVVLLIALITMPLFGHLDRLPIQPWDEARLAMNSYEMLTAPGNILVPTYDYAPDMWNTKPPLLIWMQVVSMKLFGINEIALRVPSAMAAVLLCVFLYWLIGTKFKQPFLALISCVVLVTSEGFVRLHGTRTADYDSLLTLFTTMYCGYFFLFSEKRNPKYLYLTFICLALAVLTKGVAGLLFAPGLLFWFLLKKETLIFLRSPHLYSSFLIFAIFSGGYYLLREQFNPGYINAVQENELGGRFSKVVENHVGPPDFYFREMISWQFTFWAIYVPAGIITGLTSWNGQRRKFTMFILMLSLFYFAIISLAETKLNWYNMPLFPWLSVMAAIFIHYIFKSLNRATWPGGKFKLGAALFIITIFYLPYAAIVRSVTDPKIDSWQIENMNMAYVFKHSKEENFNIDNHFIVINEYEPNFHWYLRVYNSNNEIRRINSDQISEKAKKGDKIVVFKEGTRHEVESNNKVTRIQDYHGVTIYQKQ